MSTIATAAGALLVSEELEWDKTRGWETVYVYAGTKEDCTTTMNAAVAAGGASRALRMSNGDGEYRLRLSYPYGGTGDVPDPETVVDIMELDTAAINRSVYQSPVFRSRYSDYANGVSVKADTACQIVGDLVRKYQSGLPKVEDTGKYKWGGTEYDTRELAIYAEFAARMTTAGIVDTGGVRDREFAWALFSNITQRGVTSCLEYNSVFRRTVTAGNPAAVRANFEGENKIWTTAEVIAWENIPNDGWFILPTAQWHKSTPKVLSAFGKKTQLVYSYTQVRTASYLLYEAYNSASLIL